jgi:hypothetical protein
VTAYENALERFNSDTAKTIKVFNECFGLSARAIMRRFLDEERFKSALITLDSYYNNRGGSKLINYLTYAESDGTLEKFLGEMDNVFSRPATH